VYYHKDAYIVNYKEIQEDKLPSSGGIIEKF
jgi:hypothetical protein